MAVPRSCDVDQGVQVIGGASGGSSVSLRADYRSSPTITAIADVRPISTPSGGEIHQSVGKVVAMALQTPFPYSGLQNSLFCRRDSLFAENSSLFRCLGNSIVRHLERARFYHQGGAKPAKYRDIPVIFPVGRELGSRRPVSQDCVRHHEARASEGGFLGPRYRRQFWLLARPLRVCKRLCLPHCRNSGAVWTAV